MHVSQKNLEKKFFFRIFWASLRVLVSMESTIWVRAAPVQFGYGTRTRTVRVFWITTKEPPSEITFRPPYTMEVPWYYQQMIWQIVT